VAEKDSAGPSGRHIAKSRAEGQSWLMATTTIEAGMRVVITDANGDEHEVEAVSGVEQKGHAFPLVWVNRPLVSGGFEPTPWPADAVRVASDG
jgi:hypothetical protein